MIEIKYASSWTWLRRANFEVDLRFFSVKIQTKEKIFIIFGISSVKMSTISIIEKQVKKSLVTLMTFSKVKKLSKLKKINPETMTKISQTLKILQLKISPSIKSSKSKQIYPLYLPKLKKFSIVLSIRSQNQQGILAQILREFQVYKWRKQTLILQTRP